MTTAHKEQSHPKIQKCGRKKGQSNGIRKGKYNMTATQFNRKRKKYVKKY